MIDQEPRRVIEWASGTRERLRSFPEDVRWVFGRGLYEAEIGKRHPAASPLRGRLRGVVELAADAMGDTYRLYCTLKCLGSLYVLYCHKKKSKRGTGIPKYEEDLIARRLAEALDDCRRKEERRR